MPGSPRVPGRPSWVHWTHFLLITGVPRCTTGVGQNSRFLENPYYGHGPFVGVGIEVVGRCFVGVVDDPGWTRNCGASRRCCSCPTLLSAEPKF